MEREDIAQVEGPSAYAQAAELELRDVSKRYPGQGKPAIEDLSFTVPAGEVCVLVGPSGSGKTTAMRLINRMVALSSGEILLGGRSVLEREPRELRREIGYVIQQIGLFPHQTVAENIATVPKLLGWQKERTAKRVLELLELIGLDPEEMADRYPTQLSGGQRQRVGVARALAADPPLMLMDEPFGAIDPINRAKLQDEFLALQAKVQKTVVFVTHDIDEAIKMGDRIAILREGGVLAQYDTPKEILARPADDFVARFVGADRGIKRLSLTRLADVELIAPNGHDAAGAKRLSAHASVKDALSVLLTSQGQPLEVFDADGDGKRVIGLLTLSHLERLIAAEADGEEGAAPRGGDGSPDDADAGSGAVDTAGEIGRPDGDVE